MQGLEGTAFQNPEFWISAYFFGVSVISYLQFGWDKRSAMNRGWRLSEGSLLFVAFFGGAAGGKVAQRAFRHKTRKQPFRTNLNVIFGLNIATFVLLMVPTTRTATVEFLFWARAGLGG